MTSQGIFTEEFTEEIKKCKNDIYYFLTTYAKIKYKGVVNFNLFEYQKNYIKTVLENKYVIVDKPRQTGFSTTSAGICLWYAVFHPHKEIAIVSITDKEAMYFLDRIQLMYDECPKWLVGNLSEHNAHNMEFDNGSWIEALATTKTALRGRSPSLAIIDEIAFNQYADEMMAGAMPSLIHGDHLILISTRNGTEGIGGYYYRMLEGAYSKENNFIPFESFWYDCPLYNPEAPKPVDWQTNEWAMGQFKTLGEKKFRQEILKEWILSGDTVLPIKVLDRLKQKMPIRTDFIRPIDLTPEDAIELNEVGWDEKWLYAKGFWVWKEPEEGHYYIIGSDLSTGRGDDYSTIEVLDLNIMEQVAEYRARIPTGMFSKIIYEVAKYYNHAFVAIETNTDETAVNYFEEKGYDSLYFREHSRNKFIAGWNTNNKSRGLLLSHFQNTMLNDYITINSSRLISELKTFVFRGGRPQHALKCNDDLVFAFMIADYTIEDYINQQGITLDIKNRRKEEGGEEISIAMPITPIISSEAYSLTPKPTPSPLNQPKENIPVIISASDIKYSPSLEDQYEINTSLYNFAGIKVPDKKKLE